MLRGIDRCVDARLTQSPQMRKCSRSPLHRAAAFSTSATPNAFGAVSPEDVLEALGQDAFYRDCQLESEVEAAADHSEIVFWTIDYTEAQVVSPTDMPRDSEFETGSELTEHFGFATEVIRLRMDREGIRRALCVKDISLAATENRTHTRPCVGRKTCARNWITQCKRS